MSEILSQCLEQQSESVIPCHGHSINTHTEEATWVGDSGMLRVEPVQEEKDGLVVCCKVELKAEL